MTKTAAATNPAHDIHAVATAAITASIARATDTPSSPHQRRANRPAEPAR
jgi:hypothetical protein